jgi:putative phosphoribosyl transferase
MKAHLFRDRSDAGQQLAQRLLHLKGHDPLVLALPRGGVPVAVEIARTLSAPLDLMLVRKIGVPWQPELAAGAVIDGAQPRTVINDEIVQATGLTESELVSISRREIEEIERRRRLWLSGRERAPIAGKSAIIVDDGIATGASARVALQAVRAEGARHVVLAAPVAPAETAASLRADCDEAVFLLVPEQLIAIGVYYEDFHQLDDEEVRNMLSLVPGRREDKQSPARDPASSS